AQAKLWPAASPVVSAAATRPLTHLIVSTSHVLRSPRHAVRPPRLPTAHGSDAKSRRGSGRHRPVEVGPCPHGAAGVRLPRVKPEHAPYRLDGGRIRIGGDIYGLAHEIEDPYGWVWAALEAMNGTRTCADVVASLLSRYPELSRRDADAIVAQLIGSGHVEDVAAYASGLSPRELDRYSRGHDFFRWADVTPREHGWDAQLRLRSARVLVIGVGGAGTSAAQALAASGVGLLHLVDDDRVELSNLNRQLVYTEADIGRAKVSVAA